MGNQGTSNYMHILLVHGGSHYENCWDIVKPYFENSGFNVCTVTLRGHGSNKVNGYFVSMADYAEDVCLAAEKIGQPCILIGHSMAGMVISAASELRPDLFSRLVYVTAMVPERRGSRLISLAMKYSNSETRMAAKFDFIDGTFSLDSSKVKEFFYSLCEGSSEELAERYLCSQPIRPFIYRVSWSDERLGSIPKHYIECTKDCVMAVAHQRDLQKRMRFSSVRSLESDHSPFISMPREFVECVVDLLSNE